MEGKDNSSKLLHLLSMFESGTLTVGVNGIPLLKVDSKSCDLEVEASGVKECGIKLSKILELETGQAGVRGLMRGSESTARELSERGWSLKLYDKSSLILKMGRGVSRLTAHIQVNPLKLRKILENL